jgi:hypothetical protein
MPERRAGNLEELRGQLTGEQQTVLNAIWEHYRDQGEWILRSSLDQRFGLAAMRGALEGLGPSIVEALEDAGRQGVRVTFLGVLLTDQGPEVEELLARYLEYIRDRYRRDSRLEWVGSQEVEAALDLTPPRSRLLRQLIRVSHWWGGGSGFGAREWTVGIPVDVDDLPADPDLRSFVRAHVLRHLGSPPAAAARPGTRGDFWFVPDPDLQRQVALDWREAQDAHQAQAWKACVLLCGGILEGLLVGVLGDAAPSAGSHAPAGAPEWNPAALLEVSGKREVLGGAALPVRQCLQLFRGLIQPSPRARLGLTVTQDDAEASMHAVRTLLKRLPAIERDRPGGS